MELPEDHDPASEYFPDIKAWSKKLVNAAIHELSNLPTIAFETACFALLGGRFATMKDWKDSDL
jgi:hypothetical protein